MSHVLVPVAVLSGDSPAGGLIDLLSSVDVTVLGYHELPEQTPPDQARAQFEDRAVSALEDICEEFRTAGGDAYYRLAFTHDKRQSINRVATETDVAAYTISGATGTVDRLLVPLSGSVGVERIVEFVTNLVGGREIGVTLLLASNADGARQTLESAADTLRAAGIDVETRTSTKSPFNALIEAVPGHDAVVMGQQAPSLSSLLFGDEQQRVAAASVGPVIVVRNPAKQQTGENR